MRPFAIRALTAVLAALVLAGCIGNASTLRTCEATVDGATEIYDCVAIVGRLIEFREEEGETNAYVVPGAAWTITDREGAGIVAGQTDSNGIFVADGLRTQTAVAMAFLKNGFLPAVFSGETAERDSFLYTGSVFADSVERAQDFVDEYSAAVLGTGTLMTIGTGGGAIVRGRVQEFVELSEDGIPLFADVAGATVEVLDGAGNSWPVHYRGTADVDEDGVEDVDPAATATGPNATFAAFAVTASNASATFTGRSVGAVTVRVTVGGDTAEETTFAIGGGITEFRPFIAP